MDLKFYESGASATPPAVPSSPSVGFPTDGDPVGGVPATTPGEYWFFQVAAELDQYILGSGAALDPSNTAQMAFAANQYITNRFSQLIETNGYTIFPNGLIIQWGVNLAGFPATVTFPIAFPTNVFCVVATDSDTSPLAVGIQIVSNSQFTIYNEGNFWIAIGH